MPTSQAIAVEVKDSDRRYVNGTVPSPQCVSQTHRNFPTQRTRRRLRECCTAPYVLNLNLTHSSVKLMHRRQPPVVLRSPSTVYICFHLPRSVINTFMLPFFFPISTSDCSFIIQGNTLHSWRLKARRGNNVCPIGVGFVLIHASSCAWPIVVTCIDIITKVTLVNFWGPSIWIIAIIHHAYWVVLDN